MAKTHAQHHTDPVLESGMDYAEHEKTYNGFITGVKWSVYGIAALMVVLYFVVIH
ncbi:MULTISPECIES: aa3-type cytochrome c oxidase subunit IV [Devosia]|uniref:Bacterial aa3 type cytochrome c oxidase subunit IV n=1 Tax=Devosia equisanguinis TaxID=2490941 RepID=A0A447IA09_9HYPH|nr:MULTISPECIES: aa3-type cytochrome c oxidase subunit IV [Devosia]VDS04371.1 Bacterial aa3 type cytochrome c oxidase subunit IV [Devosia equisanguinis]